MPEANELTIHVMAALAQHERRMISERTRQALAAAKRRGVKLRNALAQVGERRHLERAYAVNLAVGFDRKVAASTSSRARVLS